MSEQMASQTKRFPFFHETIVMPSGRFPSEQSRPVSSSYYYYEKNKVHAEYVIQKFMFKFLFTMATWQSLHLHVASAM